MTKKQYAVIKNSSGMIMQDLWLEDDHTIVIPDCTIIEMPTGVDVGDTFNGVDISALDQAAIDALTPSDFDDYVPADTAWHDSFAKARSDLTGADPNNIEAGDTVWKRCVKYNVIGDMFQVDIDALLVVYPV